MNRKSFSWHELRYRSIRLVNVIETDSLKTPGQWNDWLKTIDRMPAKCRKWIWEKVKGILPKTTIQYLKAWRKNA